MNDEVINIPLENIRITNPRFRDRKKFETIIESIRNLGLKKPIQVALRGDPTGGGPKLYDLVCGQGRIEAFNALGYPEIPAVVVNAPKEDLLIMSLVENMARSHPSTGALIAEIERLKQAGYSNVAIGKKLDIGDTVVGDLLALRDAGEERLLAEAVKGTIPLYVAIDIARTDSPEAQRELLQAYEDGKLNSAAVKVARKMMTHRRSFGKSMAGQTITKKRVWTTTDGLVNAIKKETQRQKLLVRKAKICDAHLMFITTAFRRLADDEDFTNLLRAEQLDTMPSFLAGKIGTERSVA